MLGGVIIKIIILNVTTDKVTIKQNANLNKGEYNVTKCRFIFDRDYNNLVKKAVFFVNDSAIELSLDSNNECYVPNECLVYKGNIEIGAFGLISNNNTLEKVYSPDPVSKEVIDGSYTSNTTNTVPLTPTDKQQILSAIQTNANNIEILDDGKVDKESGYGLSKNDFTDLLKSKLDGIEESADVNIIESVSVNGTARTISNKNVDIEVPTKTSDISNDSDFTTNDYVDSVKDYLDEKIDDNTDAISDNAEAIDTINTNLESYSLISETGNKIQLLMDNSTYKIKAILKDKNNNTLDTSNEIDLPMESVVLSVAYNSTDKELVITLQNGSITRVPLTSLISGLVNEDTLESTLEDYVLVSDYNTAISSLETGKADKSTTYTKNEVDQLLIDGNYNFATFEIDISTGNLIMRKTDDMLLQFSLNNTNGNLEVTI